MQTIFTREFMENNRGCYSVEYLNSLSFMNSEPITLKSILESEIPLKDKYWFVCKKLATKEQNKEIAISVAEIVLPIYEKHYPKDKRPREAIEAAKQYIAGHITLDELRTKRAAAADVAYAATADAAYAAAYAATAATAADAADAAAYAADAADAAYAEYKIQVETYLHMFCAQFMELKPQQ